VQTSRSTPDNGSTTLTTSAYIYKATLKVMLEEDYLTEHTPAVRAPHRGGAESGHGFSDPRLKQLNEYSTQLIRELIIPKLSYQVNTSKRYAPLRQVYYSLILAQWFKQKLRDDSFKESVIFKNHPFSGRTIPKIDSGDLTNLVAKQPYDKQDYFKQYQQSFKDGEYNLTESIYTPYGQSIRRYMSGGMNWENLISSPIMPVSGKPLLFRKYFPYLISLLVTFNFVPGVEAVTISKVYAPNNYSLGYKGVVEDEKTLEELLRNILGQYGIHNLSASEKILSDIHKENPHLGQYPLRPGTSVRITKLIESILTGIFLSECKIISKGSITVAGRLHEVYIVTKNTGIPFKSVALTLGGTIFINEKNIAKQSEIIVGELYKGLPPKIKREDIHRIIVEMTTVHEKMHLLLKRWLEEGLELSPLLISELQKLGELTQEEKNDTIQELSAYLVEIWYYGNVLSGKYEKSEYYEELCKYAIRATLKTLSGLKHLRGVAEIIDSMGLISQEMVRKLPLGEIQKVVGTAFEGLFGQEIPNDLRNGAWPANDNNKYNDAGQKDGSKSDGMVKISLNPALFPKIRDDVRREIQYLDFKTLNEVLKYLGLEGNKDMVIRLKKREGAQQQYPGKILLERVEILPGDEIIINPTKGTGSSLLSGKVLVQSPPAMETGSKSNSLTQEKNSYNKKEDMSSASSAISPRLNDLLMSIKHETDPESIDEKVKEIFAILREDSVERLSGEKIILLVDKIKYCSENFSFEYHIDSFEIEKFLYNKEMVAENLLPLFLELIYSTKSQAIRNGFLGAIATAVNVNKIIKLSQKQFDDLIDFMVNFSDKDSYGAENSDEIENDADARGWIANILSGALDAEKLNISQEQLDNLISNAFKNADLVFKSELAVFAPDDSNITMGIHLIVNAIKKDKELVIDQEHFDIFLELVPRVIDFRNPREEIRDALKLILRNNRNLQLIKDSFRDDEDILDFCNQIIKVVKEGKKVKVSFVSPELSDKFGKEKELEAYDLGDLENSIGEEIGYHNLGRVDIYINNRNIRNRNIQDLSLDKLLESGTEITIKSKTTSSPLTAAGRNQKDVGGIAFNALPIRTESAASSALGSFPGVKAFQGDIEAEWAQIQAVFNAGIRPSTQRMSEYTAAAASSGLSGERIDLVRAMLTDILRREEEDEKLSLDSSALKELLIALESEV